MQDPEPSSLEAASFHARLTKRPPDWPLARHGTSPSTGVDRRALQRSGIPVNRSVLRFVPELVSVVSTKLIDVVPIATAVLLLMTLRTLHLPVTNAAYLFSHALIPPQPWEAPSARRPGRATVPPKASCGTVSQRPQKARDEDAWRILYASAQQSGVSATDPVDVAGDCPAE